MSHSSIVRYGSSPRWADMVVHNHTAYWVEIAAQQQGCPTLEQARQGFAPVQLALERSSEAMLAAHQELAGQRELLVRAVEATGQVIRLEEALNRNLGALSGSHHFEETVQSLAAVIHLLNARLGQVPGAPALAGRELRTTGQAA